MKTVQIEIKTVNGKSPVEFTKYEIDLKRIYMSTLLQILIQYTNRSIKVQVQLINMAALLIHFDIICAMKSKN